MCGLWLLLDSVSSTVLCVFLVHHCPLCAVCDEFASCLFIDTPAEWNGVSPNFRIESVLEFARESRAPEYESVHVHVS